MGVTAGAMPPFDRASFRPDAGFSCIGAGELGGKARGLALAREVIARDLDPAACPEITIGVPALTVLTTEVFDAFMGQGELREVAASVAPDDRIAHAFQSAPLPPALVGDLRALVARVHTPLAVRSSSLLEDAIYRPFAGVYTTKMTPNNQLDTDSRFRKLVEAIKLVWASTFFRGARSYRASVGQAEDAERMAVILQEVVGRRRGDRFYPTISGVARSWSYYPSGHARPEDGVVELALGLGKTIVDGEPVWSYSPAFPQAPPPYNSIPELLKSTQTRFWAVTMGKPPAWDPLRESEYLVRCPLTDAEADGTLRFVASTFDPQANRISSSLAVRGPRLLNFAPLLAHNLLPLNGAVKALLAAFERALGGPIEIELAATLDVPDGEPARLGFLQVRPMAAAGERVEVEDAELASERAVVVAESALGNGVVDDITEVVLVKPEAFEPRVTEAIAGEVEALNRRLVASGRPYLLVGFGRWGTSDPWGGVPVAWGQISGARVIVESTLAGMGAELSQGSHFFHNLTSFRVLYLSVAHGASRGIDWGWLCAQPAAEETRFLRQLALSRPLLVKVDGRSGRGVILRHD